MEEKNYEAGRVEISSAEYRDLVTEAVESKEAASRLRNENWKLESETKSLKEELACAMKRIDELKAELDHFHSALNGTFLTNPCNDAIQSIRYRGGTNND